MSARIVRSTTALRPAILARPAVGQHGFRVSSRVRQTTPPPQPPKASKPAEEKSQNMYFAAGAGAAGLGFLFWYISSSPEKATDKANELANEASKKLSK